MREVYKVGNANGFQGVRTVEGEPEPIFDASELGKGWQPPEFYFSAPAAKACHFYTNRYPALVFGETVEDDPVMWTFLEEVGEILPFACEGAGLYFANVLVCPPALDEEATEWRYMMDSGIRTGVIEYAFHKSRLPQRGLFKLPHDKDNILYLVTNSQNDVEDDFYQHYQAAGYKGLSFRKVWEES